MGRGGTNQAAIGELLSPWLQCLCMHAWQTHVYVPSMTAFLLDCQTVGSLCANLQCSMMTSCWHLTAEPLSAECTRHVRYHCVHVQATNIGCLQAGRIWRRDGLINAQRGRLKHSADQAFNFQEQPQPIRVADVLATGTVCLHLHAGASLSY